MCVKGCEVKAWRPPGAPERGLRPPGLLQLLLRVSEAREAVVGLVPPDGPVEGLRPGCLSAGLRGAHVLHRQAAPLQDAGHRAEDVPGPQGEAHRPEP